MTRRAALALALVAYVTATSAAEPDPVDLICSNFNDLLQPVCAAVVENPFAGRDEVLATVKAELTKPEFLNTALAKQFGETIPLGLEFKAVDTDAGGTVLGLGYDISHTFADRDITSSNGNWNRRLTGSFSANGTITENSKENPRNFLVTKLSAFARVSTNIPEQDAAFKLALTLASVDAAPKCDTEEKAKSESCKAARKVAYDLLDQTVEFLRHGIQYYELGFDAGYETDQRFDATQFTLSAFVFGQYESWGDNSIFPFDMVPSARLGIDQVNPNSATPRAMAGDSSSYLRISGELSLWMPIKAKIPLVVTFNYRHYREVDADQVVRDAGLERYTLRTVALRGANGLFVSFSSGRLPFDRQDDNVVELGWKAHF